MSTTVLASVEEQLAPLDLQPGDTNRNLIVPLADSQPKAEAPMVQIYEELNNLFCPKVSWCPCTRSHSQLNTSRVVPMIRFSNWNS